MIVFRTVSAYLSRNDRVHDPVRIKNKLTSNNDKVQKDKASHYSY